jgi:hypothetical protein
MSTVSLTSLTDPLLRGGVLLHEPTLLQYASSAYPSKTQVSVSNRISIFPDFLLPGTFDVHLRKYRATASEVIASRDFKPLMPLHIGKLLVKNSFADIIAEHQHIHLSHFMTHLDAQYEASSFDPAGNSARWAIVNAMLALGVRSKTAPGSEAALFDITHGFYQNATKVVPELILEDPCLLSI